MTWLSKLDKDYIITTGDGIEYRPNWFSLSKSYEFNFGRYEFPEIEGTLIRRKKKKGTTYEFRVVFQGETHLREAENFEISSRDTNPWEIEHPYYGVIQVQPLSLSFDNTEHGLTTITGEIAETIDEEAPRQSDDIITRMEIKQTRVNESALDSFEVPSAETVTGMNDIIDKIEAPFDNVIESAENAQAVTNQINEARSKINQATDKPGEALGAVQGAIQAVNDLTVPVEDKISTIESFISGIRDNSDTGNDSTGHRLVETTEATALSSWAVALANTSEFRDRNDVLNKTKALLNAHDDYLNNMDTLQSDVGGVVGQYFPDYSVQSELASMVDEVTSKLFEIAFNTKQERSIILETQSNAIILAQRFYGLDENDENLNRFIEENALGIDQLLQIEKDTEVFYYV